MRISLVMPVYNAAATLPATLESILEQKFSELEVVFVDDCSTDATPQLIASFARESGIACQILRQEQNQGVAAARNRGLASATGDYVGFVDADDRLEEGALRKAFAAIDNAAEQPDILGWDWVLGFEKNGRTMRQADYSTPLQAICNLMQGTMRWNLWLFLVRRSLIEAGGLHFIDGADMGEDMQFMIRAFLRAASVLQVHEPLYRYNALSGSSISRQFSLQRRMQIEQNVQEVEKAVQASAEREQLEPELNHLKLFLKRPLLIGTDRRNYEIWHRWLPEANAAATKCRALPLRIRLLQGAAVRKQWWLVRLHYRFVYQFVYGILYR